MKDSKEVKFKQWLAYKRFVIEFYNAADGGGIHVENIENSV